MSVNDPIADMLTRIRNAVMARHETVTIPSSRMKSPSLASSRTKASFVTTPS